VPAKVAVTEAEFGRVTGGFECVSQVRVRVCLVGVRIERDRMLSRLAFILRQA
jgi:hypothetical protein